MKPLDKNITALTWHPAKGNRHELRVGDDIYAELHRHSIFGSLTTGEVLSGKFSFKRMGFFKPYITVRQDGTETDLAVQRKAGRGEEELRFTDGTVFVWKATKDKKKEKGYYDSKGNLLVGFIPKHGLMKSSCEIRLTPDTAACPQIPLLLMAGWYHLILENEDEIAMMTSVIATASCL